MRINFKILFLTVCLLGLASCAPTSYLISSSDDAYERSFQSSFCTDQGQNRVPASELLCRDIFSGHDRWGHIQKSDTQFAQRLSDDPLNRAEADMNISREQDKYPVSASNEMRRFRDRFLGYLKNPIMREPLTRSFEASLRMRSQLVENTLQQGGNYGQYDLVIVGSGPHGVIALQKALASNPNLKVLIIDEGDTAGATFRYGKEVFSINSSNRRSGEDTRPLPGEGNINELPGLPIQVSDLTAVKYPTANDLGVSIVSGLYAAVREYPNVEVMFNTRATQFIEKSKDAKFVESLSISTNEIPSIQIDAQKIILTTGLGEARLPEGLADTLERNPQLTSPQSQKPPRVLSFEDMIRIIATSNDPMSFFANKRIGIVGKGDSANVLIEFLLGYAAREAYARSSAQTGKPEKIIWLGQDKKTCNDYISDIRSRYQGISSGFKSSSPNVEAIIESFAEKLKNVADKGAGKTDAILDNGSTVQNLDYVILTTGFNQNVRGLFDHLTRSKNAGFFSDSAFFDRYFDTLQSATALNIKKSKVGRQFKGRQIYVLGTAADLFAQEKTVKPPAGIVQNFVSIFNNAPLVVAATKLLTNDLQPRAPPSKLKAVVVGSSAKKESFAIIDVQETRFIPNQTMAYLESTFRESLSYAMKTSDQNVILDVSLESNGNLQVVTESQADVTQLLSLLAKSREFFSLAKELLKFTPGQSLHLEGISHGSAHLFELNHSYAKLVPKIGQALQPAQLKPIANANLKLRGLSKVVQKSRSDEDRNGVEQPIPAVEATNSTGDFKSFKDFDVINLGDEFSLKIDSRRTAFITRYDVGIGLDRSVANAASYRVSPMKIEVTQANGQHYISRIDNATGLYNAFTKEQLGKPNSPPNELDPRFASRKYDYVTVPVEDTNLLDLGSGDTLLFNSTGLGQAAIYSKRMVQFVATCADVVSYQRRPGAILVFTKQGKSFISIFSETTDSFGPFISTP